jgi:hypothetical protein
LFIVASDYWGVDARVTEPAGATVSGATMIIPRRTHPRVTVKAFSPVKTAFTIVGGVAVAVLLTVVTFLLTWDEGT